VSRASTAFALVLLFAARSAFAGDPAQRWRTIETPHFHIHYYTYSDGRIGEEQVAQRLAVVAEDARRRLTPFLGTGLKRKTHVVITDDTDDFNGSATVQPYPAIRLFATSPDDRAELNDYDDWLSGLFMHEYTHILHIGTIGGVCANVLNAVLGWGLGIIYAPNQAQPRYIIEGLAVFEESARTSGGRLRNSIWDMYLRAATLEHHLQRLDQFSNFPTLFPFGNAAYLYGSALMRFVAEHYGQDKLLKLSRDYGSVCIPGGLSRALRHATGQTWDQVYVDFKRELERRYGAQRDAIAARGITPSRKLTSYLETVNRPAFTPDGREVVYSESDGHTRPRLMRLNVDTGQSQTELKVDGAGGPSLSADGTIGVFHAVDIWDTYYFYDDVYVYNRQTKEKRRLTEGLRTTNPGLSPDGKRVAFEVNSLTSRGLSLMDIESGRIEELIPARGFEQVYTPSFSPDGKTLAFSWWRENGYRDIWLMDLATRKLTQITHDRSIDLEPRFSPDGHWLYFVSDRTEVHNLYAYELSTGKLFQATNVVNGLFDPAISPDGKRVAFVGFRAEGYDLEIADLDPSKWWLAAPSLLDRPDSESPKSGTPLPSHRYNPLTTLFPWTFTPYAQPDGYGELLGFRLNGSDVAGRHAWALDLAFGTGRSDDVNFSANYSYYGLWPNLYVGAGRSLGHRGGLVINGQDIGFDQEDWTFGAGIQLPILRHLIESSDLSFSYDVDYSRSLTPMPPPDPTHLVPQLPQNGRVAGIGVSWSFSALRRYLYSVSTAQGRTVGVSLGIGAPFLGSSFNTTYSVSWRWNEFIPMPWKPAWLRDHVLSLAYAGGISGGDPNRRSAFFLGGYPPQDLLKSIYDFSRPGSAPLRGYGYGSVVGDQFHVLNVEYRFPIVWIERGYSTFPVYLRRLHGKLFTDYGGAFNEGFSFDKLKVGVGAEVMLELIYGYYFGAALQLGYAYGVNAGGSNQVYFLLNNPF